MQDFEAITLLHDEALSRLDHLRRQGPTPEAFTFRQAFDAPAATSLGSAPVSQ